MPAVQYPFIDIAVHPRVRERFARGEALVLLSADLTRALWANGSGAELFGYSAVYDLVEQGISRTDITFRQLEATARQLAAVGDSRNFMIRIAEGFQRVAVQAGVELLNLSSGEQAILVFLPASAKPPLRDSAKRMLSGLDDPDTHMAVIGDDGEIIASSPGFASLGVTQQTARSLAIMAGESAHGLVKRPVATGKGYLPAAVGRISDTPPLNLLFAVETVLGRLDPMEAPDLSTSAVNHVVDAPAPDFADAIDAVAGIEDIEDEPEERIDASDDAAEASVVAEEAVEAELTETAPEVIEEPVLEVVEEPATDATDIVVDDAADESAEVATEAEPMPSDIELTADQATDQPAQAVAEHEDEITVVDLAASEAPAVQAASDNTAFVFRPNSRATRFVWKIDAEGRFSEVSDEFAEAVGPHAADIIGVAFSDIAALFNLDPEGKIAEALARRDTWSGKTINWPIEGTSLAVPVDLAALPTYTRSREFDGFRGFGVVRLADAAEDPLALGLTFLAQEPTPPELEQAKADEDLPVEAQSEEETAPVQVEDETPDVVDTVEPAEEESVSAKPEPDTARPETIAPELEPVAAQPEPVAEAPVPEEQPTEAPRVEPPALRIVETPNRWLTDKIVQLHGAGPTLTTAEQANFREIAKRLEAFGVRASETDEDAPAGENAASGEESHAAEPVAPLEEIAEPLESMSDNAAQASADEEDDVIEGLEETVSQMDILASFIPPRVKMTDGFSAGVIDQLPVAVLIHAGDDLIHANPEFMRLTGYGSLEELSDVGGIDALLQRHELTGNARGGSAMMLVTAEDELVPVSARLQSIRWEESSALMLALMPTANDGTVPAKDIAPAEPRATDRMVEKVARLQVEVEELRSILETATDGVVVIGSEGDIRSMNRSASALFNYDEEETRGKPFVMLFAHESQRAVLDYLNGLSGHGVASVLNDGREVIGREAAGGFVPLFMTMGRLTSSNGYCAVIRDITQWKRTEDDLRTAKSAAETANAHKTDFLARVSHEIRTPLNAIIGFSDMMATERFGTIGHPRYVEYANDIGRSGRHVLDIVNDLLDISKIEAGEMDLDFDAVKLNEAISEAVSLLQPQANSQRVIIRTALSQAIPDVVADLRSIKQIALNILSNSIRFTPSGGQIVVSTSYEANGSVVLRIRDTGVGMTRSELDQAMKPFRQVSTQSRHRGEGTGLGLPLTKAMVDANRAIFAISSTPNEGTLVEIAFPSQRVLAG
ncbi:PAS domain S-box protein [Rhizobium grahamii]|uniref:histidine kinase n=1 Tax=Rhizobium grahamii TaxID=1120045 RepID=A0A5Q0C1J5_9HYPH|nr:MULTISPECIES: ATP-binding protein [Rhizobium]QFY59125.1 PAS domain S-box protein [Rhizobium grahamii]QRM48354.1 PAS domain S-box protein [Rhizobium sp. BG6]